MASKRLQKDLMSLQTDPIPGVSVSPVDDSNLLIWEGSIEPGGIYAKHKLKYLNL